MKLKKNLIAVCTSVAILSSISVNAAGFPPAPPVGKLGNAIVNPYQNSPLTAVIGLDGHEVTNVKVTVQGKGKDGVNISYSVGKSAMLTHGGIPVFGLYADYKNSVSIDWVEDGKKMSQTYKVKTGPITNRFIDNRTITQLPQVDVKKVDKKFKNRLYMINAATTTPQGADLHFAGRKQKGAGSLDGAPAGGSVTFDKAPLTFVIDTEGEYRWWLDQEATYDGYGRDLHKRGFLMGINQVKDGSYIFGQGQTWGFFDVMGRVDQKRLPNKYIDFSHEARPTGKGTYLLRVAINNYKRPDGQYVHTIRDTVIEVDRAGNVLEEWNLNKILNPLRDDLLGSLDAGAVCLNVDTEHAGHTAELEPDTPFGDALGVGPGRNWAHINSVEYDKKDDSIILSLRHQGIVKLTRDKKVKWILAPNVGWKDLSSKVLVPVDSKGKKLTCEGATCEDTDFDWTYTQHTAWLSSKGTLTVFDNGDGRNYEQPAMATDKYSRYVEYKIDEKKGTVQQIWEFGKEKGFAWYSPVTSVTEYRAETSSMFNFAASIGIFKKAPTKGKITEIDYKSKDIKLEIDVLSDKPHNPHYRALVVDPMTLFSK